MNETKYSDLSRRIMIIIAMITIIVLITKIMYTLNRTREDKENGKGKFEEFQVHCLYA